MSSADSSSTVDLFLRKKKKTTGAFLDSEDATNLCLCVIAAAR